MKYNVGEIYFFGYSYLDERANPMFVKILGNVEKRNGTSYNISRCTKKGILEGDIAVWDGARLEERKMISFKNWLKQEIEIKRKKIEKAQISLSKMEKELESL